VSVLQRKELEASPLADLHVIASELGLEGYRGLRKADLIGAILDEQGGGDEPAEQSEPTAVAEPEAARPEPDEDEGDEDREDEGDELDERERDEPAPPPDAEIISGVLDILPNGSGFIRTQPSGQSRDDVYVAPAQIRRCELRAGDEVGGAVRPPRRNERHPSLVRVETVNGRPAEPPEERPLFSELTAVYANERLTAPAALEDVPFGRGSRVAIGGAPGAGATTVLREVAAVLAERHPELELTVVLVGARPEEVTDWRRGVSSPVYGGSFERSTDAQAQAAELAVERAKRTAERGGHAALVVDSLESLPPAAARRVFGAARNTEEGGSLTIVAATGTALEPQRFASTRVMLEPGEGGPRVAPGASSTLRADLLA
jgi:transcription termination factor Rho